jgi:hypothetical protein
MTWSQDHIDSIDTGAFELLAPERRREEVRLGRDEGVQLIARSRVLSQEGFGVSGVRVGIAGN